MKKACNDSIEISADGNQVPSFKMWCTDRAPVHDPKLELYMMIFIRGIRERNFHFYIEALTKIIPWCFALNHMQVVVGSPQ